MLIVDEFDDEKEAWEFFAYLGEFGIDVCCLDNRNKSG
jgi:hypothetical protein